MAPLAIPAMIIGGAASAAGAIVSGVSQAKAGKAAQKQYNKEADQILRNTQEELQIFRKGSREFQHEQLASMGASGAVVGVMPQNAVGSKTVYASSGIQNLDRALPKIKSKLIGAGMAQKVEAGKSTEYFGIADPNMSSPLRTQIETAAGIERDAYRLQREGKEQAQAMRTSGQIARAQGNAAFTAGLLGAASSLLSTTYDVSQFVGKRKKNGFTT